MRTKRLPAAWHAGLLLMLMPCAWAVPVQPRDDAEVIERLSSPRSAPVAATTRTPAAAVRQAGQWLQAAREEADPRLAGRALALLKPWSTDPAAPSDLILVLATIEQYLHDFDGAARRLEALVARDPSQAQAWLTLATLRRVQGRYAASDQACRPLATAAPVHAVACLAENAALRGQADLARQQLKTLLAGSLDPGTRAWLLTTLAELEERAGERTTAERTYREVLALSPDDAYASLAFADFLLDQGRPAEAIPLLERQVRSDAVLLRLAQARQSAGRPEAAQDIADLRERFAQAALRPADGGGHEREQAMFAWHFEQNLPAALSLARANVTHQREPLDVLLLARLAKATGDSAALDEARRLKKDMGLYDRRTDAAL